MCPTTFDDTVQTLHKNIILIRTKTLVEKRIFESLFFFFQDDCSLKTGVINVVRPKPLCPKSFGRFFRTVMPSCGVAFLETSHKYLQVVVRTF